MAEITSAGYQDIRDHIEAAWIYVELRGNTAAHISIGSGTNGVVTIVSNTPGVAGNDLTLEVVVDAGANAPLTATLVGNDILITLGTGVSAGVVDDAKNTALLVAAAVNAIVAKTFTASYSGTGEDSIPAAVTQANFTGGGDATTPIVRLNVSDARVTWTHAPGAQTLELTTIITGSDSDIQLPQTFAASAIYKVATVGDALSVETFTQFTIEATSDQLTIKHRIEVPRVV